jgi:hypothetical protein
VSDELELTADRIAERGRHELLARLRATFEDQAGAAEIRDADLERLVADAATRADGALWRRALAQAATEELGVDLAEAIAHPAVERAAEIVGAPAWELPGADVPPPPEEEETPEAPPPPQVEALPPHEAVAPDTPPPPQVQIPREEEETPEAPPPDEAPAAAPGPPDEAPPAAPGPPDEAPAPEALRLAAVHLGGIETLRAGERDLELRLSVTGLDVLKRTSGAAIGRLAWAEIESVEVSRPRRGLRAGRRRPQELHVITERGKATFELPGLTPEQLTEHLEPMLARARQRMAS